MLGLYDHHAERYWNATRGENKAEYFDLPEHQKAALCAVAKEILNASNPYVDGADGAGVTAVLVGRQRMIPPDPPGGGIDWRWGHFYDTLSVGDVVQLQSSTRLFGNANVGNLSLTNLQQAGSVSFDSIFNVLGMYVTAEGFHDDDSPLVRGTLEQMRVTPLLRDHPVIIESGWDCFREVRRGGFTAMPRDNFMVKVEFFGDSYRHLDDAAAKRMGDRRRRWSLNGPRFVVHFEGWFGDIR